MAMMLT